MRWSLLLVLAAVPWTALAAEPSLNPRSAPKVTYRLDERHVLVQFCIRHMGLSDYCGRFGKVSGTLAFNGSQPEKSRTSIDIDVASIDTPSDELDEKLRTTFFETGRFPAARFTSGTITVTGERTGVISGQIEIRGVKKAIDVNVTFNGGIEHPFANAYAIGFSGTTTLNLDDFAFPDVAWRSFVADTATIAIEAEFIAEK